MVLGVIFAAVISRPLADEGFMLAYSIATLLALLLRAARLDALRALAYE